MKITLIINILTLLFFSIGLIYILNSYFKNKNMSKKLLGLSVIGLLFSPILNIYNWNFTYTPVKLEEERKSILESIQKELAKNNPTKVYSPKSVSKNEVVQEFTKQSALDNLTVILNEFGKDKSNSKLTAKERFNRIVEDEGSFTNYITDEALNYLYLTDNTNNQETQVNTSLTLLSFYSSLTKDNSETEVKTVLANLEYVYIDEKTKTAYIPLDFYTGTGSAMSFTMVYIDGQWKLSPYNLLQSIQLSDYIHQITAASTSTE